MKEEEKNLARSCRKLGRELAGYEREARGLSHAKRWRFCLQTVPPYGSVVCPCERKCGPNCPKFE